MLKGVEYGKSQKALYSRVQRGSLSAGDLRHVRTGSERGASAGPTDRREMAAEVSSRRSAWQAECQRESLREASREASYEDRSDGRSDRPFKKTTRDFTTEEKRRWVSDHREKFGSVSKACEAIGLSVSSYYYKLKIDPKLRSERDADLRSLIEEIQSQCPQYGVRQVYWELFWVYGKRVNRKRIHRVMREHGLRAQIYRGFKVSTTDSNHSNRIYPNLLHDLEVTKPDQAWVTDITYVRIATGFVR